MHLHFLGTSSGSPAIERNVSCTALNLLPENGEIWLFDCGEATQHQILRTSIRPGKIRRIFITHLHGDHIFGLLGCCAAAPFCRANSPVRSRSTAAQVYANLWKRACACRAAI